MRSAHSSISSLVAAFLCVLMVDQPLLAMGEPAKVAKPVAVVEMQGQTRVLHALNRLTFGPRPGDVAAVQAMGLNKWFEMQLNPGSIDDSAAEARLAEYPAMQMPLEQLVAKYPSPQMLKQYTEGKVQLPDDPAQRAMVQDQMAFYKKAQKLQQAQAAAAKVQAGLLGLLWRLLRAMRRQLRLRRLRLRWRLRPRTRSSRSRRVWPR